MACRRDDPLLDDLSSNTHLLIRGKYHSTTGSGLDSAKQVNLIAISTEQSCWIYTSKTGGQLYGNPPFQSKWLIINCLIIRFDPLGS